MDILTICLLVIVTFGLIAFDYRHKRIPNAVTIPLLLCFIALNWPGKPEIWMGCFLLFTGWQMGWMGGGDAKLWMSLLWATPTYAATQSLGVLAAAFIFTGLLQIIWRKWRNTDLTGVQSAGSWRTLPYLAWLIYASF